MSFNDETQRVASLHRTLAPPNIALWRPGCNPKALYNFGPATAELERKKWPYPLFRWLVENFWNYFLPPPKPSGNFRN